MKLLLVLSVLLSSLFLLNKSEELKKNDLYVSYNKALEIAKNSDKTIMLKLTAEHCGYCKKMDREVLIQKKVRTLLKEHFVSVEIDVDKETIPLGIKRTITPTFIFVDKNEKILSRINGSWNKSDFLDLLDNRIKK